MRRTVVFGPAYLDRVLLVDGPLLDPADGGPLDQSVDGTLRFGSELEVEDPHGRVIAIAVPHDWPGPSGTIGVSRPISPPSATPRRRETKALSWHDDLGGMGAGFAAALGGELISALGPDDDPTSQAVKARLALAGIQHRPIVVPGHTADWTLLLTSGPFGDKLPIGFRGCHAALSELSAAATGSCDLRVVASLTNRRAAEALRAPGATTRMFAPAIRNATDRQVPVPTFAESIDVLCCNRGEWENLEGREEVAWQVSVLAITDGPRGSLIRFTTPAGDPGSVQVPAFPRSDPPRDTNRAGEAYAANLITTLLDGGWRRGEVDESLVRHAALRASAAAALVLDRVEFGFPSNQEVDQAIRAGVVTRL